MVELTQGIFQTSKSIFKNNRGSLLRTLIYTIGHFAIAIICLMLIADVSFMIALTDAIVEPLANSIWYFVLDKNLDQQILKKRINLISSPRFLASTHPEYLLVSILHQLFSHCFTNKSLPS